MNSQAMRLHAAGKSAEALTPGREALAYAQRAFGPDHSTTDTSIHNLASIHEGLRQIEEALTLYNRSLAISEKINGPEHTSTGTTLNNLGWVYASAGQLEKAIAYMARALAISEKGNGPDHPDTGIRLESLAVFHERMGQCELAIPLYVRALRISDKPEGLERLFNRGPSNEEMTVSRLSGLAECHEKLGQFDQAVPTLERILAIREASRGPNHPLTATSLNNLALMYKSLGLYDKSLGLLQRALAISEKTQGPEHRSTAISLSNLAALLSAMGQAEKALPLAERALAINERSVGPEHPGTGASLSVLAGLYSSLGQYGKALPLALRAFKISEIALGSGHPSTGKSLNNLAALYVAMGDSDKALPFYLKAYAVATRIADPRQTRIVQGFLALFFHKRGQTELAIFFGKASVNSIQRMRVGSRGLDGASQKAVLDSNRGSYELLAQWLIEAGRLPEAQQVLAMLKEDEIQAFALRAQLQDQLDTRAQLQGRESDWQGRSDVIAGTLGRLAQELEALRKVPESNRTPEQRSAIESLLTRADQTQAHFESLLSQIQVEASASGQRIEAQARAAATRAQSGLEPLLAKLAVDGNARPAALQYLMTEHKLYILVTLPQLQFAREYPISARDLRGRIDELRRRLRTPDLDPRPLAQDLYKILLGPVIADLQSAGTQHLMVSLTDALRYIPFAVLHDGTRYLTQKYQLSMMTEAALGSRMDKPRAQWSVAALGVAAKVSPAFSPLPAVSSELQAIVKSPDNPGGSMPGQVYLDGQFTAARYRQVIEQGLPVIHIATHFRFSPGSEDQNYLLLGDGQSLSLADMMSRRFRFQNLDLLTLSACETALGSGSADAGREFESLGARAQLQGASAVIATLWQVADESTGHLMRAFYSIRAGNPGLNKAEALRRAQLMLLEGSMGDSPVLRGTRGAVAGGGLSNTAGEVFRKEPDRPFAHPFYWAPFVLMGNWL